MQLHLGLITTAAALILTACAKTGPQPQDPYESYNRRTFAFNQGYDKLVLKPLATIYSTVLPAPVRAGINNAYDNINMIPTVANDLLQTDWNSAIKDSWRFVVNSSLGIGGVLDVASTFSLPPHSNDLGITFAHWGVIHSPYVVIPFLGSSTFRDGMGFMFNYTLLTPYPYLNATLSTSLIAGRYVVLRSQMQDTDRLMNEALDKYTFMRDAYLQHRNYLITGEQASDSGQLYIAEETDKKSLKETKNDTVSPAPITPAHHATHRTASA